MNKLKSLFKISLVFVLAVLLGLWSGGFFERYVFYAGFTESFSKSEARNLIGRRVKNTCQQKPYSDRTGEIVSYSEHDFGDVFVEIRWEIDSSDTSGVLLATGFGKGRFKQCIGFAEAE